MTGVKYSFHLTFADGSNPYYHFPAPRAEHEAALQEWQGRFELQLDKVTETTSETVTEWYTATERSKGTPDNQGEEAPLF